MESIRRVLLEYLHSDVWGSSLKEDNLRRACIYIYKIICIHL